MDDKNRKRAVLMFKALLRDGMIRKNAIAKVCREFGIDRSTLYRWVKMRQDKY